MSRMIVPTGTSNVRSSASFPYCSFVLPGSPLFAAKIFVYLKSISVFTSFDARSITEPHFPPFPPAGPPKGTPDSRRADTTPSHPLPD